MTTERPARRGRRWRFTLAALALWGTLVVLWLLDTQAGLSALRGPATWLLPIALLASLASLVERLFFLEPPPVEQLSELAGTSRLLRGARLALAGLLALSLLVRFVGVDHEVEERAYRDEGTYWHHATEINGGDVIRRSFVYPHLTYEAYAFALWSAQRLPGVSERVAGWWDVDEPLARDWLLLRSLVALLSALTVWPVFGIAWRIVGRGPLGVAGGVVAGLLLVFSPAFNDGSHLIISDVPAACLATFSLLFVAGLLERERLRDYLLAGVFAGLAAAAKYPAGTVVVAVAAVWLCHRLGEWRGREERSARPSRLGLLWAGLASLATFLAVMPSLFVYPGHALFGGRGIFFGVRQYGEGGWIGVVRENDALYYLLRLAESFGWLALAGGLVGALLLERGERRRWWRMTPFPVAYFLLLVAMSMVVARNAYPLLPILAALLGSGLVGLVARAARLPGVPIPATAALTGLVLVAALVQPVARTLLDAAALAAPSTRQEAEAWAIDHLPPGARVLHEEYTPKLPPDRFDLRRIRFAARLSPQQIERRGFEFVVLAKNAWGRFFDEDRAERPHHRAYREHYRTMLEQWPLLYEIGPSRMHRGPEIQVRSVPLRAGELLVEGSLEPSELFVPDAGMRRGAGVVFDRPGQWLVARLRLPAGDFEVSVRGVAPTPLRARLHGVDGATTLEAQNGDERGAVVRGRAPAAGRYWLQLFLSEGSRVEAIGWRSLAAAQAAPEGEGSAADSGEAASPAAEGLRGPASISASSSSRVVR